MTKSSAHFAQKGGKSLVWNGVGGKGKKKRDNWGEEKEIRLAERIVQILQLGTAALPNSKVCAERKKKKRRAAIRAGRVPKTLKGKFPSWRRKKRRLCFEKRALSTKKKKRGGGDM